jgi:hypothetical protein
MSFIRYTAFVATVCLPVILAAQSTTQSIEGLVTDATGASIANAKVTIANAATGVTSTVVTNSTGSYTFPLVPVGEYDVKVEMSGFKSEEIKALRVETAAQVRQDFQLQVGAVNETVEVAATTATLTTETASTTGS